MVPCLVQGTSTLQKGVEAVEGYKQEMNSFV